MLLENWLFFKSSFLSNPVILTELNVFSNRKFSTVSHCLCHQHNYEQLNMQHPLYYSFKQVLRSTFPGPLWALGYMEGGKWGQDLKAMLCLSQLYQKETFSENPSRRTFRLYCAYKKPHSLLSRLLEGLQNRCIEKNDILVNKLRKFDLEIIGV